VSRNKPDEVKFFGGLAIFGIMMIMTSVALRNVNHVVPDEANGRSVGFMPHKIVPGSRESEKPELQMRKVKKPEETPAIPELPAPKTAETPKLPEKTGRARQKIGEMEVREIPMPEVEMPELW